MQDLDQQVRRGPDDPTADAEPFDPDDLAPERLRMPSRRRVLLVGGTLLALVMLIVLPPLINVNRFRRQIASSVSLSLGRPVRIDSVALTLLPMPGFTLTTFMVGEDPAFGSEPVIKARSVRVTLRWSSLWRRRVEFSKITLEDPSVNLVHLSDGRWNLQSILLQAARMPAAPTAQKGAGDAPRFPYIEATGARVNLKMGAEKMPLSLTDAKFALWLPGPMQLPEPMQWKLRLEGHPTRTDAAPTDTGLVEVEGTLGKAGTLGDVPIDLQGAWRSAPLGAASAVVLGQDGRMRGDMTLTAAVKGTVGRNSMSTRLQLSNLRRSEFVPERTLNVDIRCTAQAVGVFHGLEQVRCAWPADTAGNGLLVTGEVPDTFHPKLAGWQATLEGVPAEAVLDALRVGSARLAANLTATGVVSGNLSCCTGSPGPVGTLAVTSASLARSGEPPFLAGNVEAEAADSGLTTQLPLALGGATPAMLTIAADHAGLTMHLTGTLLRSRLMDLADAVPQIGDGLADALGTADAVETPTRVDLIATRPWFGVQTWSAATPSAPGKRHKSHR